MFSRTSRIRLLCCSLLSSSLAGIGTPSAEAQTSNRLVSIEPGDLPIILTAPHGGSDAIPGVPKRQGTGVSLFRFKSDDFTDQLTEKLADAIEQRLGRRPYVVIARFHRKYLDANRRARDAYESPHAAAVYDTYHRAISDARREIIERWGSGLLVDIHGQAAERQAIFRGTQNGETTAHLINHFGRDALIGPTSLFGLMAQQGITVIPATGSTTAEHSRYDGGYTVVTHGSRSGEAIDAIQLELGRELREPGANVKTAQALAEAIAKFSAKYLPASEQSPQQTVQRAPVFFDDFSNGTRTGWFTANTGTSSLSVKTEFGQLSSLPELNFSASATESVQSFATHFPGVELRKTGDCVSLNFDARHSNNGFVNRGFRFGLFNSGETHFQRDTDASSANDRDDSGYFAMVDLGRSTAFDSAVIRESNNATDERLWNGGRIAADQPDNGPDPLMFTRNKNYHFTLTLTRNETGSVDITLKNNVSGDQAALRGTSKLAPTFKFDTLYFGTHGTTADFAIDNVTVTNKNAAKVSASNSTRVGVYVDEGAGSSVKDLLFVLSHCEDVSVTRLTAEDIRNGKLADLDLLMQPGGSGGGQGRHLGEPGREAIRRFVNDGGGFVGICAGAYLATADYTWSLNILDAKVVDRPHWNRGTGTVDISLTDAGRRLLAAERQDDQQLSIHYAQGPLLAPGNRPDIDDYEIIATFESEIAKNGAPRGVMKGTTAIAKGNFGRGRVLCFSPHPEMTNGLHHMVQLAIDDVKRIRSAPSN